jgi:hypothetical protein
VRIAFALDTQKAGYRVERWAKEDDLKAAREYIYSVTASGTQRQVEIIPNAYLRILLLTTSRERLSNLKRATEQAGGQSLFWFATLQQASPEAILSERICQIAGHEGMVGLITDSSGKGQASALSVTSLNPCPPNALAAATMRSRTSRASTAAGSKGCIG